MTIVFMNFSGGASMDANGPRGGGRRREWRRGVAAGTGGNAGRRVSNPRSANPGARVVDLRSRRLPGDAWDADACGVAGNKAGLVERHTGHER